MRQIAHLDMDAFFVAVERARDPNLCGRPVIIGGRPGGRGVVAAASHEARECGVRSAMPVSEAVRRCPHAMFVEGAFERYLEASGGVDHIVRRYAPRVEWVSIDEAYLDLTGTDRALGHALRTTEWIQRDIRAELQLDASAGVATSKVVAKIAAQFAKPRGLLYVLPGYEARFLAPLPIDSLPTIDPRASRRLHEMGVRTLGQLANLPDEVVNQNLGRAACVLARRAAGVDDSPVTPAATPRPIARQLSLLPALPYRSHRHAW
jgi:DNA polymerase-4